MDKCAVILLSLLVASSATFWLVAPRALAIGITYIHPDGTIEPAEAPITTSDYVTYSLTGDLSGSLIIERSSIVVDGSFHTVLGDGTGEGFKLVDVNGVTIKNVRIQDFTYGIYLELASFTVIKDSTVVANTYDGIAAFYSSNMTIINNTITQNLYDGIECYESSYNNITRNQVTSNNWFGLSLYYSSDNKIDENKIANNYNGIEVMYSSANSVFRNNFSNHTTQASVESSSAAWDNGWDGNYWSDYLGADSNGDGIGDNPYTIDQDNVDRFPLMNPFWSLPDINHDLRVDMRDIGLVATAYGSSPSSPKWNPHADITGRYLVPDEFVDMRDIGLTCAYFGKRYNP